MLSTTIESDICLLNSNARLGLSSGTDFMGMQ